MEFPSLEVLATNSIETNSTLRFSKEKKIAHAKKYRNQTKQTNLFTVNMLVGDEIQRHGINMKMGLK